MKNTNTNTNTTNTTNENNVIVDKVKVYKSDIQCNQCGHIPIHDAYMVIYDQKTIKCFCSSCFGDVNFSK